MHRVAGDPELRHQWPKVRNAMRYRASMQVRAYWEALRKGRLAPLRSEIDPKGISGALGHAFILERTGPLVARVRLLGHQLAALFGSDVRGLPVTALFSPEARLQVAEAIEQVFGKPEIAELWLTEAAGSMRRLNARMTILPLQSDLGDISRAIGCLETDGWMGMGTTPFTLDRVVTTPISVDLPAGEPLAAASGLAEDQALFHHAPPTKRGVPHLRLIRSEE